MDDLHVREAVALLEGIPDLAAWHEGWEQADAERIARDREIAHRAYEPYAQGITYHVAPGRGRPSRQPAAGCLRLPRP